MSYAASTTLFDSTYSKRIPRDLQRTWSIYERRSLRVSRHLESRRETNGSLSITVDVTIVLDSSVACLPSPEMHENRKFRTKPEWQRNMKMATAIERVADGIAYVAHNLEMGNLTDTRSFLEGDEPRFRSLDVISATNLQNDNDQTKSYHTLRAPAPVSPWISRSRVDNGVNPARRVARIRGQ